MGIDIIWLMPIHPIGEKNRKGKMGSYYSVEDYYGVNPQIWNFGGVQILGGHHSPKWACMCVVDWVANHSAWDNPLTVEHPEWYTKTKEGNFQPTPWYDWDDIIDFDYDQPGLRQYMTEVLKYWVKEAKYRQPLRCRGVPSVDFWDNVRAELDDIKPVFMLAKWKITIYTNMLLI